MSAALTIEMGFLGLTFAAAMSKQPRWVSSLAVAAPPLILPHGDAPHVRAGALPSRQPHTVQQWQTNHVEADRRDQGRGCCQPQPGAGAQQPVPLLLSLYDAAWCCSQDGVSAGDVEQGELGDCYLLGASEHSRMPPAHAVGA